MLNKLTELAHSTLNAAEMEFDTPSSTTQTSIPSVQDETKQTSSRRL
jgi:hypothetical protein